MSSSSYEPQDDAPDSRSEIDEPRTPVYDYPNTGPSSPQIQDLTLASSPQPIQRKRKRVEPWAWNKRENHLRRTKAQPLGSYKELLDETVDTFTKEPNYGAVIHTSLFGIVTWTPEEKIALFAALGRKGKSAVSEIASIIGTKSRIEVQEYLLELQRALQEHHKTEKNVRGIALSDIHAAAEISEECCIALEKVSNSLSVREEQAHNLLGKRKYQDMWLVDRNAAMYLEEKIKTKEISDVDPSAHAMLATAQLFHVSNWINLSRNVFMNFGSHRVKDNWTKICFHDETPSMTCDSFTDFYTIAVSLTRRLVQSSIFFTLSRIRAMDERGRSRQKSVRKDDVQAALKALKVQPNSREFWINAARRCSLDVREFVSKGSSKTMLISYDEVERRLSSSRLELPEPQEAEDNGESHVHNADISSQEREAIDRLEDTSSLFEGSHTDTSMDEAPPAESEEEILSDEEESYALTVDKEISREEEKRLWQILNQTPKSDPPNDDIKMESEDEEKFSNHRSRIKPPAKRKTIPELQDWRNHDLPMAEWELFGSETVYTNEEISKNHRIKRRKIGDEGSI
ncbi:hypothetical protein FQN49_008475 [Arthroderma sp. PD_2]|nr:hypothetical protein FQN49_008475 [Arthroderma sp. PD_2]